MPCAGTPLQEFLLPSIPELLGLDAPLSQQQQAGYGSGSSAYALPGAGGLMLQAWNFTGMLTGGGLGSRSQNPGGAGGQGSTGQQGHAAAAVDDAISRALQLRDQLYGQQLMQGFDPQELRMVRGCLAGVESGAGVELEHSNCKKGLCSGPAAVC